MKNYFNTMGDKVPNRFDEIHIDCIEKKVIYDEYVDNMELFYGIGSAHLSYQKFCETWDVFFPNVKAREHKNITGHCHTCEKITSLRKTIRDNFRRGLLTQLHAFHR